VWENILCGATLNKELCQVSEQETEAYLLVLQSMYKSSKHVLLANLFIRCVLAYLYTILGPNCRGPCYETVLFFGYRSSPKIVESLTRGDFVCYLFVDRTSGIVRAMYLKGVAVNFM